MTTKSTSKGPGIRVRLSGRQQEQLEALARREGIDAETYFNREAARVIRSVLGMSEDLSVKEAGAEIGVHHNTIRNMLHRGEFPNRYMVGTVIRIPRQDIEAMRERNRAAIG